jgi:hypothetical protein
VEGWERDRGAEGRTRRVGRVLVSVVVVASLEEHPLH